MAIAITQTLANNTNALLGTQMFHEAHVGGTITTFGPRNANELGTLEITDRFNAITMALNPQKSRGTPLVHYFGAGNRPTPVLDEPGSVMMSLSFSSLLDYLAFRGGVPESNDAPVFERVMGPKYFDDLDRAVKIERQSRKVEKMDLSRIRCPTR